MDERKKSGIDFEPEKVKVVKKNIIETQENTIIISDFVSSDKQAPNSDIDDDENDNEEEMNDLKSSEQRDALVTNLKRKQSKESSLINERLSKLEKKFKALQSKPNSKNQIKKRLKLQKNSKNKKSIKKFNIKESKVKAKEGIKKKKKRLN